MFKGLPGSGKDTKAKELISSHPGKYKRVNKDDLRSMLDNNHWTGYNEKFVLKVRDFIITEALKDGKHVLCTDTNLDPKHEVRLSRLAKENDAQFIIEDLTNVDIEECIQRDLKRINSVGERVIKGMYNKYLRKKENIVYPYDSNLPDCVICDLDGTLALFGDENPYERDFENDKINDKVLFTFRNFMLYGSQVSIPVKIILSGRSDKFKEVTDKWLDYNNVVRDYLHMRNEGDTRKDVIVKEEMFNNYIRGKFNPILVLDDRQAVVDLWRSLGLTCFQVSWGNF